MATKTAAAAPPAPRPAPAGGDAPAAGDVNQERLSFVAKALLGCTVEVTVRGWPRCRARVGTASRRGTAR
jgi:hypothetical protein